MKKDRTQTKSLIEKIQSLVLTVVAVVAPVMFIYSQFQSLQTLRSDLSLKKDAVKHQDFIKQSKIDCHIDSLELSEKDAKKDYVEEYEKCINAIGL